MQKTKDFKLNGQTSVKKIYHFGYINFRSYNVCLKNELFTLNDLINYFKENTTFIQLKGCGFKSDKELIDFCLQCSDIKIVTNKKFPKREYVLKSKIRKLSNNKLKLLNLFIEVNFKKLPLRCKKALYPFLENDITINSIIDKVFYNKTYRNESFKDVGVGSSNKLNIFYNSILEFIEILLSKNPVIDLNEFAQKLNNENNTIKLVYQKYQKKDIHQRKLYKELNSTPVIKSQSIFEAVDILLNSNLFLKKNNKYIIQNDIDVYQNYYPKPKEILLHKLKLPKLRYLGVCLRCIQLLYTRIQHIDKIEEDMMEKYGIDLQNDMIYISQNSVDLINSINKTNYSHNFITFIIAIYVSDTHKLVGNYYNTFMPSYNFIKAKHVWESIYIVKNNILGNANLDAFLNKIEFDLENKRKQNNTIELSIYLSNFLESKNDKILKKLIPIIKTIVLQEIGTIIDEQENIIFKQNCFSPINEYAVKTLEEFEKPTSLNDLFNYFSSNYPGFVKTKNSLRTRLLNCPEIIAIGKSKFYGLKKWESIESGIKGGSIKKIIYEYLEKNENPIHLTEIINYVKIFRSTTTINSVMFILSSDKKKRFVRYQQNYIGLIKKEYDSKLTSLPKYLNRNIFNYIIKNILINRDKIEQLFSEKLQLEKKIISEIVQLMLDRKAIHLDSENNLFVKKKS